MSAFWQNVLGLTIVSAWLAAGCTSPKKIDVGGTCILNSDCGGSLVCTWGICHVACRASSDCQKGESCIAVSDQSMVCQKPTACTYNSQCPTGLTCAVDQQCRKQCLADVDCSYGQTCTTTNTCAELNQVDSNKNLLVPDGGVGGTGGIGGGGGADAGVADAIIADAPVGTGGIVGTDGNVDAGSADGSEEASTGNPPGYYVTKDWNVTSVDWHGCVWTYVDDTVRLSTTNITPLDFTTATTEGGPYSVTGTVFNDYNSFAMVGFNLNESITGSSTQCAHDLSKIEAVGPPAATMPGSATGIAFNWSRGQVSTNFRIQIQSSDAYTNANHRWCAAIPDAGPSFIRFSDFYTQCWYLGTVNSPGTQYDGEPIDAVVFLVVGTEPQRTPFDFTISGFAPGNSVADAP
jgi:hypothetical protein